MASSVANHNRNCQMFSLAQCRFKTHNRSLCRASYQMSHSVDSKSLKWPKTFHSQQDEVLALLEADEHDLMNLAMSKRDANFNCITFSPKVFIPLTKLCRDSCGYCVFAQPPSASRPAYMSIDEVLAVAEAGREAGCTEALFTLGDKPELRWPQARQALDAMGYSNTLDYVVAAAKAVMEKTGLLPHINAGVMEEEDLVRLKDVSASQGILLEGTSPILTSPGGAHSVNCPDKDPDLRLATIDAAGRAGVPFTSGILIGLGESRHDRLDALLKLRSSTLKYGHIQEIIVQSFRAKPGTAMCSHPELPLSELLWTVAAARLIMPPSVSIQAPPNLSGERGAAMEELQQEWRALLDAGINDWGGISPVTLDHVNPERPWPALEALAAATSAAGFNLVPRLPVYPRYAHPLANLSPSSKSTARHVESLATHRVTAKEKQETAGSYLHLPEKERDGSIADEATLSTSYPLVSSGGPWLSTKGGRSSVAALVWKESDSYGLARGSEWCPGKTEDRLSCSSPTSTSQYQLTTQSGTPHDAPVAREESSMTGVPASLPHEIKEERSSEACRSEGSTEASTSYDSRQSTNVTKLPRNTRHRAWRVGVGANGLLEGSFSPAPPSAAIASVLTSSVVSGTVVRDLSEEEIEVLLSARGSDLSSVIAAADSVRRRMHGDTVTYVVNRNLNYTNVCALSCSFCAFSKGRGGEELRGSPYMVSLDEVSRRCAEAWDRGAAEVCMQGGIAPGFTGDTYLRLLAAAKRGAPDIHVHAFSPLEVYHGASTLGVSVPSFLQSLKAAGLGSLPGTAAEVLDERVRQLICPDKLSCEQWVEVVEAAHHAGLPTTSTIMFGHVDDTRSWARHLVTLRKLQARTGGITEFVPLPFVHMEAPMYLKGLSRRGPTLRECVLLHAVSRLALPNIPHLQASWVKMGPERSAQLLAAGCDDMGGVIMNESITRAAGAGHGQELPPERMEALIREAGRIPRQRTTTYGTPSAAQTQQSFGAAPLLPVLNMPAAMAI